MLVLSALLLTVFSHPIHDRRRLQPPGGGAPPGGAPPSGGDPGTNTGSSTNVHISFGSNSDGARYSIDSSVFVDSFMTASGTYTNYDDWWTNNVGANSPVAEGFCETSEYLNSVSGTDFTYNGPVASTDGSVNYFGMPNHDVENYCSAEGGDTPPLMGTSASNSNFNFDLSPANEVTADISNTVGLSVNGIEIFSPFTAISTVAPEDETLDTCTGHPANEKYHYHGYPNCLADSLGDSPLGSSDPSHSSILGWSWDGFPIYGPWGYSDPDDMNSAVRNIYSSYVCADDADCKDSSNWSYDEANGDLDGCNGRWTKTPEFPNGVYVYVFSVKDDGHISFPGVPYCTQSASSLTLEDGTENGQVTFDGLTFDVDYVDGNSIVGFNDSGDLQIQTNGRVVLTSVEPLLANSAFGFKFSQNSYSGTDRVENILTATPDARCDAASTQYSIAMQYQAFLSRGWLYLCDYIGMEDGCNLGGRSCQTAIRYNGVGNGFDDGEFELVLALDEAYGVYETIAGNKDGNWESFNTKVSAISDFMDSSDAIYYSIMVEAAGDLFDVTFSELSVTDNVDTSAPENDEDTTSCDEIVFADVCTLPMPTEPEGIFMTISHLITSNFSCCVFVFFSFTVFSCLAKISKKKERVSKIGHVFPFLFFKSHQKIGIVDFYAFTTNFNCEKKALVRNPFQMGFFGQTA